MKNYYDAAHAPGHPKGNINGYVRCHVLLAEKVLGKPLPEGAVVHHSNGTKVGPIVICENHAYHMLIHQRMRASKACGHASWRKCQFCKRYDRPENIHISHDGHVYHYECSRAYDNSRRAQKRAA